MIPSEPMTVLTDLLMAVLGGVWGARLVAAGRRRGERAVFSWGSAFLAAAVAALAGGVTHGYGPSLRPLAAFFVWKLTLGAIGLAALLLLAAIAYAYLPPARRRILLTLAAAQLALYLAWISVTDDFRAPLVDYGLALLVVLAFAAHGALTRRDAASGWIVAGTLVAFLAAAVQASGLTLHPQLNHNDLYHLIQLVSLYLLFRGGMRLRDRAA